MKLLEFIVASSLLTLMPGPDILFVMAQSIVQGRKTGIAVALGLCSGLFVHTALAALGISLIIASSPILIGRHPLRGNRLPDLYGHRFAQKP